MLPVDIQITNNDAGQRLDKFLKARYLEYTRFEIQKAIEESVILLNGRSVKSSHRLKIGDNISGTIKKLSDIFLVPNNNIPIEILFECPDFMVINKQSGIPVYPSKHHQANTVANGLLAKLPVLGQEFYGSVRAGIVHRLDKDTSGTLLVAKNQKAFIELSRLFSEHLIKKTYRAIIAGNLEHREGLIDNLLIRSLHDYRKRMVINTVIGEVQRNAKRAITRYRVLQSFNEYDYIEAYPETGRMHQLRVHFASMDGHAILGDQLYGSSQSKLLPAPRLMLHASRLEFVYQEKKYSIEAPLPHDFTDFLAHSS